MGASALFNITSGTSNVALGFGAGSELSNGDESNNIDISNVGVTGDSGTTRIGAEGTQTRAFIAGIKGVVAGDTQVMIDSSTGQLGVPLSSQRYKRDIQDMGSASEAILALRPVTFRYKEELDPKGTQRYGLVAEEVAKISPDLVVRDASQQIVTVRYDFVNAMLLNEFRKQHDVVLQQQREIEALKSHLDDYAKLKALLDAQAARLDALEKTSGTK
jgi:hypothetical protein